MVFALIWGLLTVAHIVLRRMWRDSFMVSSVAAVVLAALALSRYRWGIQQGMQQWGFLTIMTLLGCASFLLRASQLQGGESRDAGGMGWWSSGCGTASGGGCGGGCGGGGCGGCGGG